MGFRELVVWQRAMELVISVYRATKQFPRDETYGLVAQMRRAAVSVPSNIAEGRGRYSRKELVQFLTHSRGSLLELQTQVKIARLLNYLDDRGPQDLTSKTDEVGRLLNGTIKHFKHQIASEQNPAA